MTLHDHGSLSEEAGKLAEILEAWLAGARQSAGAWAAADPTDSAAGGERLHSPECRVCPICRLLALLRGVRPETYEHLLDAAASLVAALRVSVEGAERSWTAGRPATVQRIDIG
jgi:hypothetical protein